MTYYEYDGDGRVYLCESPVHNGCIAFDSLPTRAGYSFFGWYLAADDSGLIFADERGRPIQGVFSHREDLALYAHWAAQHDIVR